MRTAHDPEESGERFIILIPVYNDWAALGKLLPLLDSALARAEKSADLVAIDDGSAVADAPAIPSGGLEALRRVSVLRLRRNLGHQRAIAIGLAHVEAELPCRAIVLMDGDGEDDPADVPRLIDALEQAGGHSIVFAERTRRSETLGFRVFYQLYRAAHLVLTGVSVRVGNFSAIPRERLISLVAVSELWNHYAAAVFASRQPYTTIPTRRARRLDGKSRMNFVGLVIHGLSALSVFSDVIGVRLLILASLTIFLGLTGMAVTASVRMFTNLAIPGWATTAFGLLLVLTLQATTFLALFCFMILAGRNSSSFLPVRDHVYFVSGLEVAHPKHAVAETPRKATSPGIAVEDRL